MVWLEQPQADVVSLESPQARLSKGLSPGLTLKGFLASESSGRVGEVYVRYSEIIFLLEET